MKLPYSSANKKFSKLFVNTIKDYTNGKVKLVINWNTCNIQSLFNYKDKAQHHSCVIYHRVFSCGADYIEETIENSETRWKEHSTGGDKLRWFVLSRALKNCLKWKILEAY